MTTASRLLKDGPAAAKGKRENKMCAAEIILALCCRFMGLEIHSFQVSREVMQDAHLRSNTQAFIGGCLVIEGKVKEEVIMEKCH